MRRGFWFAAGAGAGAYAAVRARRMAEILTVDGLRDRWEGLRAGAEVFAGEAAAGRVERESELRERFGLRPDGTPALGPGGGPAALDLPESPPDSTTTADQEGSR